MRQTSRPERDRSLADGNLDVGDIELASRPAFDFLGRGGLEEQRQRLFEVAACLGHAVPLAGNIHFGAECDIAVAVAFDNRG